MGPPLRLVGQVVLVVSEAGERRESEDVLAGLPAEMGMDWALRLGVAPVVGGLGLLPLLLCAMAVPPALGPLLRRLLALRLLRLGLLVALALVVGPLAVRGATPD